MSLFDRFIRGSSNSTDGRSTNYDIIDGLDTIKETVESGSTSTDTNNTKNASTASSNTNIKETSILEDKRQEGLLGNKVIQSVSEEVNESTINHSPSEITKLIADGGNNTSQILLGLRESYSNLQTYAENEEMSKDPIIGSVMEVMADDSCQINEKTGNIVDVECDDDKTQRFLTDFLYNNVNISDRVWTWAYNIAKHGDMKLRRMEYYAGSFNNGVKSVYYEDVTNPYAVSRIEYMGNVLGYEDEDIDDFIMNSYASTGTGDISTNNPYNLKNNASTLADNREALLRQGGANVGNRAVFERADDFVHFMSSKLSKRDKIYLNVRDNQTNKTEIIRCYRVEGSSLVDNARYIFRINNLLDNMLILSRVARSTQYNLVKVEVGNASPGQTQDILSRTRRTLEGTTRLRKNSGMNTDASPIPINSNVYIPTRDGKGDVTVESVGDSVDVRSIVDIDYFRDKEFATLKVPKQYMGFEEALGSTLGNNSLVKMDLRYARSVQRLQTILINGITALCNNYLLYRGRGKLIGTFKIKMAQLVTSENAGHIDDFTTLMQACDSSSQVLETYKSYIDKAKWFNQLLNMGGITPANVGSEKFMQILKAIKDGTYKEEDFKEEESEEDTNSGWR